MRDLLGNLIARLRAANRQERLYVLLVAVGAIFILRFGIVWVIDKRHGIKEDIHLTAGEHLLQPLHGSAINFHGDQPPHPRRKMFRKHPFARTDLQHRVGLFRPNRRDHLACNVLIVKEMLAEGFLRSNVWQTQCLFLFLERIKAFKQIFCLLLQLILEFFLFRSKLLLDQILSLLLCGVRIERKFRAVRRSGHREIQPYPS